jgi:hypothetical protein
LAWHVLDAFKQFPRLRKSLMRTRYSHVAVTVFCEHRDE